MNFEEQSKDLLNKHKLRKTPARIEVLTCFINHKDIALSHQDIESELFDSDRITLYRTLKTFESKGLIHQAIDGSGTQKYALCALDCSEHHHVDDHPHFHCNLCGKTICMENHIKHNIEVPQGFQVDSAHLVIQGTCNGCN